MADFGYTRLVMGDRLRDIAKEDTPLAHDVAKAQANGGKVSHEIVMRVFDEYLSTRGQIAATMNNGSAAIALRSLYDGIPRFTEQKNPFDDRLNSEGREAAVAVELVLSEQSARAGVAHRLKRENRGDDADEKAVTKRLGGYFSVGGTKEMLEEYDKEGRLVAVDAELGFDINDPSITEDEIQAAFSRIYQSILNGLKERR
jgi:adenylate kinase family enzyme